MKKESVKKSLEKSTNVLEEKRKMAKQKISIKKETYPADCRKIAAVDSNKHDWD